MKRLHLYRALLLLGTLLGVISSISADSGWGDEDGDFDSPLIDDNGGDGKSESANGGKNLKFGEPKSGSVFLDDMHDFQYITSNAERNVTKFRFVTEKSGNYGAMLTVRADRQKLLQLPSQYPLLWKNDLSLNELVFEGSICPIETGRKNYNVEVTMNHETVGIDTAPYSLNVTEYDGDLTDNDPEQGLPGRLSGNGVDYYFVDVPPNVVTDDKQISVYVKRINPSDTPSHYPQYFAANIPSQKSCPDLRAHPQCSISYQATLGAMYPGNFYFDTAVVLTTNFYIDNGWSLSWVQNDTHEHFVGCTDCDMNSVGYNQSGRISSLFSTREYQGFLKSKTQRKFGLRFMNTNYKGVHFAPNKWTLNGFPCSINMTQVCTRNPKYQVVDCNPQWYNDERSAVELLVRADANIVRHTLDSFGFQDTYHLGQEMPLDGTIVRILGEKIDEIEALFGDRSILLQKFPDKYVTFAQGENAASFVQQIGNTPMKINVATPGRYYVAVYGPPAGYEPMEYRVAYCIGSNCDALSQYDDRSASPDEDIIDKDQYCAEHKEEYICRQDDGDPLESSAVSFHLGILESMILMILITIGWFTFFI
jgi:hypothetical protein